MGSPVRSPFRDQARFSAVKQDQCAHFDDRDQCGARCGYATSKQYPVHLRRVRFKDPESGKTLVFLTNQFALPAATICALYKPLAGRTFLQMDQAASSDQKVLRHVGQRGEDANLDSGFGLCFGRHRQ
jgi:hypothetical protein